MRSFRYALAGLGHLFRFEQNAWLHMAATAIAVTAGVLLGLNLAEWLWITLAIGLVWMAECFNTAVERLCDLVTTQRDERVAVIKDLAAGGVLIATIVAIVIGVLVLVPQLGGQR